MDTDNHELVIIVYDKDHRVTKCKDGIYYYEMLVEDDWIKTEGSRVECLDKFIERTMI